MGAKLSCLPCKKIRKKSRKGNIIFNSSPKQENRSSSEILRELQILGFVQESVKSGGVKFMVEAVDAKSEGRRKIPRRLPNLTSKPITCTKENFPNAEAMTENTFYTTDEKSLMEEISHIGAPADKDHTAYNNDDKDMMVEIRRIGALADKGNMARQHDERRREVLERRGAKRQKRICKTKEKLQREKERQEILTPDLKPKRPSYEERRQKLLERRNQLLADTSAKFSGIIDDVKQEIKCFRSEQDEMPDVST